MTTPDFFSKRWAESVRDALAAGPPPQARAGKLPEYWDFFDRVRDTYQASWALGCRDLLPSLGGGPAYLLVQWDGGTVTGCQITGPGDPLEASYVLGMDYRDWKALHEGYDAQRTVMYRKILLEDGDLLEFFKGIYFFVECLAVVGTVPANYPALAGLPAPGRLSRPGGRAAGRTTAPPDRPGRRPATARCR